MSIYPNSSSALQVLKNKLGQPEGMMLASLYGLSLSLMATGFESCLMFSLRLVKTECCLGDWSGVMLHTGVTGGGMGRHYARTCSGDSLTGSRLLERTHSAKERRKHLSVSRWIKMLCAALKRHQSSL